MFADEFLQESLDHLINNSLETKLFVKSYNNIIIWLWEEHQWDLQYFHGKRGCTQFAWLFMIRTDTKACIWSVKRFIQSVN